MEHSYMPIGSRLGVLCQHCVIACPTSLVKTVSNIVSFPLGAPIDPTFYLSRTVSNVICSVVFGKRFDYEDQRFQSLMRMINESFVEMSMPWAQVLTSH